MRIDTPFFSASVGKLFVAAAVLALARDGRVSLEDPLTRFVPRAEFAGLPVEGGDAALDRITVPRLLSHRSGLPDCFSGPSRDGARRLFDRMVSDRDRPWTRGKPLDCARAHSAPIGPPGGPFHHADTNCDLLGVVLEQVTGQPFHQAVRALVREPLGLRGTWYHAFEAPPPGVGPRSGRRRCPVLRLEGGGASRYLSTSGTARTASRPGAHRCLRRSTRA
jgi:D-alanyl-D-alanine carboxypeptidase